MPTATVMTKYVNPPAEGKKQGTIKDAAGKMWGFFPDKVSFSPGLSYDIEYTEREFNGKTFSTITKATAKANGANGNGHSDAMWQVPNFVSNVVGQAITAGLIKDPHDVKLWAAAAFQAGGEILGLKAKAPEGVGGELNDEIPF